MTLKSTSDFGPRKRAIWLVTRRFVPARLRFFFEGCMEIPGQLYYAERKLLYKTIRKNKPQNCFEIGTWNGGGSTFFIAQALNENKKGFLHTVEINPALFQLAKSSYKKYLPQLQPFIRFHLGDYRREFDFRLEKMERVDFVFLDGAENAMQTREQYKFFDSRLKPGSLLLVHDWLTEKTRLLRPEIENSGKWAQKMVLLPPVSVGMVLLEKRA
jgi:predicted O-methyltransferase YrrM